MDGIIKVLNEKIEKIDEIVYPNTCIPIYQVLSAFFFGLLFGPYHQAFIWSLVFYIGFEYIIRLALKKRPHLYCIKFRVLAIMFSLIGIIFSKYIWSRRSPMFNFFVCKDR